MRGVPDCDVPDVAGRIIEVAWKSRATYDPRRGALDTWLYSIVRRHAAVYLNKVHAREEVAWAIPSRERIAQGDPETAVERAELHQRAMAILARSPAHLAAVFVAVVVEETCAKRYAAAAGLPFGTVWSWLRQARHFIAREIRRENAIEAHALARRRRRA
jgi:DNA-directed RNA polymerase specialized sigma24 family protein